MADPKPFSQYLAEAKAKLGTAGTTNNGINLSGLRSAAPKPGKQDVLSWFIDILSRPMRAVQNIPNQALNEIAKQQEAEKTGKPYDLLGGFGNVATAGVRGFFSTNPEDQPSGNQLIEKTTDVIGQAQSPNYKNVEDNVNPWVKGIGGFALDVGLDPLTYLPGAVIAKAAGKVGAGVKVGAQAAAGAVASTKLGKAAQEALKRGTAADQILAEADNATVANKDSLIDSSGYMMTQEQVASAKAASTKPSTKPSTKKKVAEENKQAAEEIATNEKIINDVAENATEATKMAVAGERVPLFSENLAAKGDAIAPVREFSQSIQKLKLANQNPPYNPDNLQQKVVNWLSKIENQAKKDPNFVVTVPQKTGSNSHGAAVWNAEKILSLRNDISRMAKEATSRSLGNKKQLESMIITAFKTENPLPRKLSDVLEEIKAPGAVRKEALATAFGPKVIEQLSKMNEATFIKATDYLAEALSGKIELANPAKMTTSPQKFVRDIMEHNDIEIPSLKSVQNRTEPIVGSELAVANEAAIDAGKTLEDVPELSNIPEENVRILAKTLTTFLNDFLNLSGYKYEKAPGVMGTAEEIWKGLGKRKFDINGKDQMSLFMQSIRDLTGELKSLPKTVQGTARANKISHEILARMRDVAKWFDDKGGAFFIGVGEDQVRMDFAQMLTILNDKATDTLRTNVIKMAIANYDTLVPISNIEDAVLLVLKNPEASDEEIIRALEAVPRLSEGATAPPNALRDGGKKNRQYGHYLNMPNNPDRSGLIKYVPTGKKSKKGEPYYDGIVNIDKYREQLVATIRASASDLQAQVAKNMDDAKQRLIAESRALTLQEFEELLSFRDNPEKLVATVRAMPSIQSSVMSNGAKARVVPEAGKTAAVLVERAANPTTVESSKQAVKTESVLRNSDDASLPTAKRQSKTRKEAVENSQKNFDTDAKAAKEGVEANKLSEDGYGTDGEVIDMQAKNQAIGNAAINMHIGRTLNPWARFFNISANAARTAQRFLASKAEWTRGRAEYQMQLRNILKDHGGVLPGTDTTIVTQAFRNITNNTTMPETAAAEEALKPVIQTLFGLTEDGTAIESLFMRAGGTEIDMLAYMKKAGIEFNFDLDLAKRMADENGISLTESILSQWKRVFTDADRPIELLNDIHYGASLMVMDKAVASSFMRVDGLTSRVPKNGYGLIPIGLDPLQHPFLAHLPEGTYVDVQYLTEIKRIEEVAMENRTFSGPFGTWLNGSYTPLLNAWKRGVTVYRLGHHIRNFLSSESLQYVAEGTKYYGKSANAAARILAAHRSYDGVDWVETVQGIGNAFSKEGTDIAKMPTSGEVLFESPNWGKMTIGRMYEAAEKSGLFTGFKQSEDLLDDMVTPGAIQKFSSKIALEGTVVERVAGGIAEYQTHYNRLHHFAQILMKEAKSGRSFEDVAEAAAWRVKRHHPDSSMLASGEAKLRAVIPFYTWFRLTMPVIAEGIATNPGRFLTFPKAWYNGAVAMGVDPYSMSDPFPQDQLFPSFLRDQINGPMFEVNGNYFGFNPGVAYFDVLNQFVADPIRGTLGMVTPAIKIPGELIGGTQWQTGARIKDFSDYVDNSLPGINYLSNLTGYSATGSLWGVLSGTGFDQQLGVAKGDKTDLDKGLSLANWFTGFGLSNMSKQSYIDYAEIEKRNEAARNKAEEEGTARSPF
jgi:hypothetical protein